MILAIVGTLAAVAAALIAAYQVYLSRFSLGVDLTLRLDERFESPEFQKKRCAAAHAIKRQPGSDIEDVLDFFESIGLLTRRGALDEEFVYSTFFYWLHGYASKCRDLIAEQRREYPPATGTLSGCTESSSPLRSVGTAPSKRANGTDFSTRKRAYAARQPVRIS